MHRDVTIYSGSAYVTAIDKETGVCQIGRWPSEAVDALFDDLVDIGDAEIELPETDAMLECRTKTCDREAERRTVFPADAPTEEGQTRALCRPCIEAMHDHSMLAETGAGFRADSLSASTTHTPHVVSLSQTTTLGPRQWTGQTEAGHHVYVRHRGTLFTAGVGVTADEAVRYARRIADLEEYPSTEEAKALLRGEGWTFAE